VTTRENTRKWMKIAEWESAADVMTHETDGNWLNIAEWDSCSSGDDT
jgi:hypothetical protein